MWMCSSFEMLESLCCVVWILRRTKCGHFLRADNSLLQLEVPLLVLFFPLKSFFETLSILNDVFTLILFT